MRIFRYVLLLFILGCYPSNKHEDTIIISQEELRDFEVVVPETVYVEIPAEPIVIVHYDTLYVEMEIEESLQRKYTNALRKYLGVREIWGPNDGPEIRIILKNCGFEGQKLAWCACFLNQGLIDIGLKGPKNPGWSPVFFSDKRRIIYKKGVHPLNTYFPEGSIGGIYYPSLKRVAHVFSILEDLGDGFILTIEGNTNSGGSRDGDGVYVRIRNKKEIYMVSDWLSDID